MTVHTIENGALRVYELPDYWRETDAEALFADINARALAKSENQEADVNTLMDDYSIAEGAKLWVKDGYGGWLLRDVRPCAGGGTVSEVYPRRRDRARYVYEPRKPEPRLLQDTREAWR